MSTRRFHIIGFLSAAFFTLASAVAYAELFKWTNEDGTTTYSTQPPADPEAVEDLTKIEPPRVVQPATPPKIVVETMPSKADSDAQRAAARAALPQAVRDPCLTSSDRYCHQKNAAHYRPYVGYTPEANVAAAAPPVPPPARGGTAGTGAGGAVSGGSRTK